MKIGYGKAKITPPVGVELNGYGYFLRRRNKGVLEDLYARAVVLELAGETVLFFEADLIGLTPELSDTLEDAILQKYGIKKECILIASIHTHTGPSTGVLCGAGEIDLSCYRGMHDKFMCAVDEALADMEEVCDVSVNQVPIHNSFAHNRVVDDGEIDDFVRTVFFKRASSHPVAFVNYSCHPVSYEAGEYVSSDYCGILCRKLEKAGIDALYLNGFCGNINPRDKGMEGCAERAAKQLFDLVLSAIDEGESIPTDAVRACGSNLPIELLPISIEEIENYYDAFFAMGNMAMSRAIGIWAYTQKGRLMRNDASRDFMKYKALVIGKILFVYHAGEVAIEFGKLLTQTFPDYMVIFVGNAFATTRYVPTEALVARHEYEGFESSFAYNSMPVAHYSGEHHFEKLIEEVQKIV